jgi:hypothetical protein
MPTTRERRAARWRAARAPIAWTVLVLGGAGVIAIAAIQSLSAAQQACFMQDGPCPGADDPRLVWLVVALFGMPLVWLLGLLLLAVRSTTRGRG